MEIELLNTCSVIKKGKSYCHSKFIINVTSNGTTRLSHQPKNDCQTIRLYANNE